MFSTPSTMSRVRVASVAIYCSAALQHAMCSTLVSWPLLQKQSSCWLKADACRWGADAWETWLAMQTCDCCTCRQLTAHLVLLQCSRLPLHEQRPFLVGAVHQCRLVPDFTCTCTCMCARAQCGFVPLRQLVADSHTHARSPTWCTYASCGGCGSCAHCPKHEHALMPALMMRGYQTSPATHAQGQSICRGRAGAELLGDPQVRRGAACFAHSRQVGLHDLMDHSPWHSSFIRIGMHTCLIMMR